MENFIEIKEEIEFQNEISSGKRCELDFESSAVCCLCPEGMELMDNLREHLKDHEYFQSDAGYKCCDLGHSLQVVLLNHLLSHFVLPLPLPQSNTDTATEVFIEQEVITHIVPDDVGENSNCQKKKPSYNSKYNQRDRSPFTQNLHQEYTVNNQSKMFVCNFCRNSYRHKQTVQRHLSKEHDSRKVGGSGNCNSSSTESDGRRFFCNICKNSYKHKQTIERHLLKEHNIVIEKNRLNRSTILENQTLSNTKKEKKFICDMCGTNFLFRESLRKHLLRHIKPSNIGKSGRVTREKIVCDKCTKLVDPSLMNRHIQVHHSNFRPYVCDFEGCKTSFFDITKFRDHKNIHAGFKPYVCEYCQEAFHYASNYRQHKIRHTDPERYRCDICQACFVSSKSLRLHRRLHNDDPDSPKQFVCSYDGCEKEFRYIDRLKLHISNVHRSEPEMKCRFCPLVISKRKYYKRHLLKVHKIREGNPRCRVFPLTNLETQKL